VHRGHAELPERGDAGGIRAPNGFDGNARLAIMASPLGVPQLHMSYTSKELCIYLLSHIGITNRGHGMKQLEYSSMWPNSAALLAPPLFYRCAAGPEPQVRQLEIELAKSLFRTPMARGVIPYRCRFASARTHPRILTQVRTRARQELEEQRNGVSGHFALGLPPSLGRSITVPLVKAFGQFLRMCGWQRSRDCPPT